LNSNSADLASLPAVLVVIPAFSRNRWDGLREAVASVNAQTVKVVNAVVVIDHNPELITKAVSELPGVTVVANTGIRGASGARNTGAAASRGEIPAFRDVEFREALPRTSTGKVNRVGLAQEQHELEPAGDGRRNKRLQPHAEGACSSGDVRARETGKQEAAHG